MTTKAPSTVKPSPAGSLEKLAYECVAGIPVVEPHELDRLGYNVYLWLQSRRDPLDIVVRSARVRMHISEKEALTRIRQALAAHGVSI
jgi:hypothetical protein